MKSEPNDVKLLIGAAAAVLVAGLLIAAVILVVLNRAGDADYDRPVAFGEALALRNNIAAEGPVNFAGSTGDTGFWIALEDHELVALLVAQTGRGNCNVRFALSKGGFVDCNDTRFETVELARYRSKVPTAGKNKGIFVVDLTEVENAPRPPVG